MRYAISLVLVFTAASIHAQPVYKCGGTYTDQPCKGGQEIDILPTDGMHSLSGSKRQSNESILRHSAISTDQAIQRGMLESQRITECGNLLRERQLLDAKPDPTQAMQERRFQIRKSQFELKCKPT